MDAKAKAKAKASAGSAKPKPRGPSAQKQMRVQVPNSGANGRLAQHGQTKKAKQGPAPGLPTEPPSLPLNPVTHVTDTKALPHLSASFSSLVALIPPRYYLVQNDFGDGSTTIIGSGVQNSRFYKNVRGNQANKKEAAKVARMAKLNPANHASVEQVVAARAAGVQESSDEAYDDEDSDNESLPFAVDDDDESDMEGSTGRKRKRARDEGDEDVEDDGSKNEEEDQDTKRGRVASIGDLRSRLQERIASLQKKRGVVDGDESSESPAVLAERKRRGEMRDRRRRERKEARRAAAAASASTAPAANINNQYKPNNTLVRPNASQGGRNAAPTLLVSEPKGSQDEATQRTGQVFVVDTSASNVQYGGEVDDEVQKLAEAHHLPRDPKTALAMLQARKAKTERKAEKKRAKHGDSEDPSTGQSDAAWDKATAAAAGVRVRDNEAMLHQAAARKDRAKVKGKAAWTERTKSVADAQAARQAKREENIAIRKQSKKGHKPHPKDTRKTSSASRPGAAGKRSGMEGKARGKGKGGRK